MQWTNVWLYTSLGSAFVSLAISGCSSSLDSDPNESPFNLATATAALPGDSPLSGTGTDFWTAFPIDVGSMTQTLSLKIVGDPGTTGSVSNYAGTLISPFTIPTGGVSTVLPSVSTYHLTTYGSPTNQGVHIEASAPVRVVAGNLREGATSEAWSVWSSDKLGTDHIVLDPTTSTTTGRAPRIALVGATDNTTVTIRNGATTMATANLDVGQTYQFRAPGITSHAGWTVTSNNPVVVMSGAESANDVGPFGDPTLEQMPPVRYWGNEYVVAPGYANNSTSGRSNHLVVASQDGTSVTVTPSSGSPWSFTLNAREFNRFASGLSTSSLGYVVSADKPIAVASHLGDSTRTYDATLILWPPTGTYISQATLPTFQVGGSPANTVNYLVLTARQEDSPNIHVNGAALPAPDWKAIGSTDYAFARVNVPAGSNSVVGVGTAQFAVAAMGGNTNVSYGYSSQYDLTPFLGICGDGLVETTEQCDDGNLTSGDGCSSTCAVEPGYVCTGSPSVCTLVPPTIDDPVNGANFEAPWSSYVNGSCAAGMTVTVTEGSTIFCTTTCTSAGTYSCTGTTRDPGIYSFVAEQKSGAQTSPPSDTTTVTVGIPADRCWIEGELVPENEADPASECRACIPTVSQTGYSNLEEGTACTSDGFDCTTDVCISGECAHSITVGCFIDGTCVAENAWDPGNSCKACQVAVSRQEYTVRSDGSACEDDGLLSTINLCEAGECVPNPSGNCDIDGSSVAGGAFNTANDCEWCDPSSNPTGWSARDIGAPCTDDGLGWTLDVCDGTPTCTHIPSGKCWIEGALVDSGTINPANECEGCNPSASASGWSPLTKGTACEDDGRTCTLDVCDGAGQCDHVVAIGCLIEGECVADRASDPGNDCYECNARYSRDGYSPKPHGENCDAEAGLCDGAGHCWPKPEGVCTVDGVDYENGTLNPLNDCEVCNSFLDSDGWVSRARGAACEGDDLPCTSSVCDGSGNCGTKVLWGCLIDDECVVAGSKDPTNDCMECSPAQSQTSYVARAAGSVCADDGDPNTQDLCDGKGLCEHPAGRGFCLIDGETWDAGSIDPNNGCRWCDPTELTEAWSIRAAGIACSTDSLSCTNDVCDAGTCEHTLFGACLIEGACVGIGGMPLDEDCLECNPEESTDSYSAKAPGSVCSSEAGDPMVMDACDSEATCTHKTRGMCTIAGKTRPEGVSNPANECEWCDPDSDPEGWSPKAAGNHCADDSIPCTADVCDSAGNCTHDIMSGSCAIDNECIGPGVKSPTDPCLVCDPEKSKTNYVPSGAKECIPCHSDDDCEPGEMCDSGVCVPVPPPDCRDDDECPEDEVCESGVCVNASPECLDDEGCPVGEICEDEVCVPAHGCLSSAECPEGEICDSGICVPALDCISDDGCPAGMKCETFFCVPKPENACVNDAGCPEGQECDKGVCKEPKPTNGCTEDAECKDGVCLGGKCVAVSLEGGGCGCRTVGSGAGPGKLPAHAGLLAVFGALIGWVRRRKAKTP